MAPQQQHVCITHPCAFCSVVGNSAAPGNSATHQVLTFPVNVGPAPWEDRMVERFARLSPTQRAAVELLVNLYLE